SGHAPLNPVFTPLWTLNPQPYTLASMPDIRIGLGYDIHRTIQGRPLVLANVTIPHAKGLDGHSDADVVIHALIDALTGAVGLPDVGQLFPNTDPRFKNINSAELLKQTLTAFHATGYR